MSVAEDIIEGLMCSHCGVCFEEEHGYPVLCHTCFDSETKKERGGLPRAINPEL